MGNFLRTKTGRNLFFTWLLLTCTTLGAFAQAFTEGFANVPGLTGSGWVFSNQSTPIGTQVQPFQGNATFAAQSGAATSYAAFNFNAVTGANTISAWMLTPTIATISNGDVFSFWSRTVTSPFFPDRLEVRLSTNGASTNTGAGPTGVGDFTTVLLTINPTLTAAGYPNTWTQYTITVSGLGAPVSGRFAFRYFVTNGGPSGANSDFIGIDEVSFTPLVVGVAPDCATSFNPANGATGISLNPTLSWAPAGTGGTPTGYLITMGDNAPNYDNLFSATDLGLVTSQAVAGLTGATTYGWKIEPYNGTGTAAGCGFNTFTTLDPCNTSFFDNGGSGANYTDNANVVTTLCPNVPTDAVQVQFNSFNTEATWDALYVYNGPNTSSPMFLSANGATNGGFPAGGWWGNTLPGTGGLFTATDPSGCLTFEFLSDASFNFAGWDATVTCYTPTNCSAANPGNTLASSTSVCPGTVVNLSVQNDPLEAGLSYQWYESPDGITYSPIGGATASTYAATVNAVTYYYAEVTCSNGPVTANSTPVQINILSGYLCAYCPVTNAGSGCMNNVTINTLNNTTPACQNPPSYYSFQQATTNLLIGNTYPFSITVDVDQTILSVWIDFDHSGTYDVSEWTQVAVAANAGSTSTVNITIPGTALPGLTGMRVRSRLSGNPNGAGDACLAMGSGETEDYYITLSAPPLAPVNCAINFAPANGATNVSTSPTLSWSADLSGGAGLPDGYLITMGDNAPNYDNLFSATDLGNVSTQALAGLTLNTTYGWKIEPYNTLGTATGCTFNTFTTIADLCSGGGSVYCAVSTANTCDEVIQNVTLGTINNSSGCNYPYVDFTGVGTANLSQSVTYPISVLVGPFYGGDQVIAWFDWDQNASFDVGEEVVLTGGGTGVPFTGNVVVPGTATLGLTRMRVRLAFNAAPTACGPNAFSEVEDYCINVTAPPTCAPPTNLGATNITASAADLTFDCAGCTGTFELEWGTLGFVQGSGTTVNPATSPVSISGLVSNTQYSFYVRQDCGGGNLSPWSGPFTFQTLFDCAGAPVISACGVSTTATFAAGTGVFSPNSCGFTTPGREALFSFTPTQSGTFDLQLTGGSAGWVDWFWKDASGTCDGTGWNCIDDIFGTATVSFGPLTAGTTYWILGDPEGIAALTKTFQINCPPPPLVNDDCANAINITCAGGPVNGTTTGSNFDVSYTDCGAGAAVQQRGVWYRYVGDNQQVTITTCDPSGIGYDTRLTVYSGACGTLACVTANDDMFPACATGGFRSEVTFNALTGTDYYVFVHGFGAPSATGNFILNLTCSPLCLPLPANDDCASAQSITAGPACVTTAGNNACASSPIGIPTCLSPFVTFRDVWYSFSANTTSANVNIAYGSATDAYYAVYDGCGGAQLACGQALNGVDNLVAGLTIGTTYYVQVLSPTATAGTFNICVTDFVLPDPCTNITNITCATSATSTFGNIGAYNPVATSCGFATPGSELIWSFTAPSTGTYGFVVTNVTGTDFVDYFYKDASGGCSGTGWTCIDDISGNATNNITLTAGVTYLFMGDRENFLGNVGTKTVNISIVCPGSNTWLGNSNDWFDPTNWSSGSAPSSCADNIVIPVTPNNPIIVGAPATAGNVDIATGVVLTLQGQSLQVCGNWSSGGGAGSQAVNVGSGEVILQGGSTAHTISGSTLFDILTVNDFTVSVLNTGAQVSIGEGLHLQNGTFGTSFGTLTLLSPNANTAAYIDDFSPGYNGAIQGPVTAQRGIPVNGLNQHFTSSPVDNAAFSDLTSLYGTNNVYVTPSSTCSENELDAASNYGNVFEWVENAPLQSGCYMGNWRVKSSGNMDNARGYSVYLNGSSVADLTGVPNTGNQSISGLGNSNWSSMSAEGNTYTSGWHMVGNPYPSPIYLDDNAHMTSQGFDAQAQVWVTSGPWQGTWNPVIMGAGGDAEIAAFQGFQVHNSNIGVNQTFTFFQSERERTSSINPSFNQLPNQSALQLVVEGNNFRDRTRVFFNSDATYKFDIMYDADKLLSTQGQPTIYSYHTLTPERRMGINTLKSIAESPTVPVAFLPGTNGTYIISATGINTFDPTTYIYLEDLQTGAMHNLRNGSYTYTSNTTDNRNRFVLHFTPPAEIASVDATCDRGGKITISQPGTAVWNYAVSNDQGTLIGSGVLSASQNAEVYNLPSDVYTITLIDNAGYTVVKNVMVSGISAPVATFNVAGTPVANQDVTFNNTTADAVSYEWNFGDGTIITGVANPTYVYSTPGTYTVELTIANAQGCVSTVSQSITVAAATGIVDLASGKITIYGADNRVFVDFSKMKNVDATIDIYNVIGQQLSTERFGRTTVYAREIRNLDAAYVIVKVKNGNDTITKKVFIANTK